MSEDMYAGGDCELNRDLSEFRANIPRSRHQGTAVVVYSQGVGDGSFEAGQSPVRHETGLEKSMPQFT